MKRFSITALCLIFLALATPALATGLTVTPPSVKVGQEVTFFVKTWFGAPPAAPGCPAILDFGDKTKPARVGWCTAPACGFTATHAYTAPGRYRVRAYIPLTAQCNAANPTPPRTVTAWVTVKAPSMSIRVTPPVIIGPRARSSRQTITYRVAVGQPIQGTIRSTEGVFRDGGGVIGRIRAPVEIDVNGVQGATVENLELPPDISLRVRTAGAQGVTYTRDFYWGDTRVATASARIGSGTGMALGFSVVGMEMYFDNQRPNINVKRNQPGLRVHARLKFTGSGLLRGQWEVDGKPVAFVNRHLVSAMGSLVITSPRVPELPTFAVGTHTVRFVINSANTIARYPLATYFVTTEEFIRPLPINLDQPGDGAVAPFGPVDFAWSAGRAGGVYQVEFYTAPDQPALFAAQTTKAAYRLPEELGKRFFKKGTKYVWRVRQLTRDGQLMGQSPRRAFSFAK